LTADAHRIDAAGDDKGGCVMDNDRFARYGALTGLVSVILIVVGFAAVLPKPPAPDASAASFAAYYSDHKDAIRIATLILSTGLLFYVWFLGSLSSALRSAIGSPRLPTVAFGGGLVGAIFFVVALAAGATAAYRPDETSPELIRTVNDFGLLVAVPASAGFVALFAATALVILRSSALPSWLGWLSGAGAVASLAGFGPMFTQTGAFAPDGAIGLFFPFAGFVIPIAALSIVIYQNVGKSGGGVTDRVSGAVDRVTGRST
jgi:hypothetical protein